MEYDTKRNDTKSMLTEALKKSVVVLFCQTILSIASTESLND